MKKVKAIVGRNEVEATEITIRLFPSDVKALMNLLGTNDLDDDEIEEDFEHAILSLIRTNPNANWNPEELQYYQQEEIKEEDLTEESMKAFGHIGTNL